MTQQKLYKRRWESWMSFVVVAFLVGVMVFLLMPAVRSDRAFGRMNCENNLRQIGLALHNYHDKYSALPPAYTTDRNGRLLHSWRTLILPFLGHQKLHDQIRLDEPWNSAHNRPHAETKLDCYMCPSSKKGLSYFAITIHGGVFEGKESRTFSEITDGTSNTVVVFEMTSRPVSWMQPVDFDQTDLDQALAHGLAGQHPGGALGLLTHGSVRFYSNPMKPEHLIALLTRSGGEPLRDGEEFRVIDSETGR